MVRLTRNSSAMKCEEDDASNDGLVPLEEDDLVVADKGPRTSDSSYAIKVAIAPRNELSESSLYSLRHPKNGCPVLYRLGEDCCDEIVSVGEKFRSWFFGESVVEDGSIRLFSPVHPLFLAFSYLIKEKTRFIELDDLLKDEECPAISILASNKQFMRTLDSVADKKEVCETVVFRFNEEKALEWLRGRFDRLKAALVEEDALHKVILEDEEVFNRYAFGVLCDFLCPEFVETTKKFLAISDAPSEDSENRMGLEAPMKRRAGEEDEYSIMQKPAVKKAKESVVKKQLQQASKGTKSIGSFFTKKK